jgi:hypothetical protein
LPTFFDPYKYPPLPSLKSTVHGSFLF